MSALAGGSWIGATKRLAVLMRGGGRCTYCRIDLFQLAPRLVQIDHAISRRQGGDDDARNLLPACAGCNRSKGSRNWWEVVEPDDQDRVVRQLLRSLNLSLARHLLTKPKPE